MKSSRKMLSIALGITLVLGTSMLGYAADRKHGDVENIGNRSLGSRVWGIFPNFVSLEREIALGQQVASEFEQTAKLIQLTGLKAE